MTGIDNWEYARWVVVVGRSLRLNPATGVELTAARAFITNVMTLRTWLDVDLDKATNPSGTAYGSIQDVGKMIVDIGRNMYVIPILSAAEKGYVDTLIAATGNRRYGDKANLIGSDVTHP